MKNEAVAKAEHALAVAKAVTAAFPDARLSDDRWVSNLVVDHISAQCGIYSDGGGRLNLHLYARISLVGEESFVRVWQCAAGGYGGFAEVPGYLVLEALMKGPAEPELRATVARMMKAPAEPELRATVARMMKAHDATFRKEHAEWEARRAAEEARLAAESEEKLAEVPGVDVLVDLLSLVIDPPFYQNVVLGEVMKWSDTEKIEAETWAARTHADANDSPGHRNLPMPECVRVLVHTMRNPRARE